jgi:hypothetical protein
MNAKHREFLREVMKSAWSIYRTNHTKGSKTYSFGHCLEMAWRFARWDFPPERRPPRIQYLQLSPSLIVTPIGRSSGRNRRADYTSAYTSAKIGS